jgi:hypothetical protein
LVPEASLQPGAGAGAGSEVLRLCVTTLRSTLRAVDEIALAEAIAEQAETYGQYDIDQLAEAHGIVEYDDHEPDYEDGDEPDDFDTELYQQDLVALQQKIGRRLTAAEHRDLVDRVFSPRGDADDLTVAQAFEQAGDRFNVDDSRQGRVKSMSERMNDKRTANAPEDSGFVFDPDNSTRADRHAYYAERLKGTEFVDAPSDEAA